MGERQALNQSSISKDPAVVIVTAEPQLFVSDMERAIGFYSGKLGFALTLKYGDPTFYAQVARDGARINLRLAARQPFDRAFVELEGDVLCATLTVQGIESLFLEYNLAAVEFHQELRPEAWGSRTFIVRDPDSNLIAFAGQ